MANRSIAMTRDCFEPTSVCLGSETCARVSFLQTLIFHRGVAPHHRSPVSAIEPAGMHLQAARDPALAEPARCGTLFSQRPFFGGTARGFKSFWRWKSQNRARRPPIDQRLRDPLRRMSRIQWGAPRFHGVLLTLGFDACVRVDRPHNAVRPSLVIVHERSPPLICGSACSHFLVLSLGRRQLLWFEVPRHRRPIGWPDRFIEAFRWTAPAYLVHDIDRVRTTCRWTRMPPGSSGAAAGYHCRHPDVVHAASPLGGI